MAIQREAYEFNRETKLAALRRCEYRCESCGKHKDEVGKLYFHHKLMIEMAVKLYPDISHAVIKSLENCVCLCHECHLKADLQAREEHRLYALSLKFIEKLNQAATL